MAANQRRNAKLMSIAIASFALSVLAADADTVNITADDGKVRVSGQIANIDERSMTVLTDIGLLTFDVDAIRCDGFGCPHASLDKIQPTSSAAK